MLARDLDSALKKLLEFERTFRDKFHRDMTPEERHDFEGALQAIRKLLQLDLKAQAAD